MDKVLEKWDKLGFLVGIESDENKMTLANHYEELANFIISAKKEHDEMSTLAFPIIRRVLDRTDFKYEISVKEFVLSCTDIMKTTEYQCTLATLLPTCYNNIDAEAEMAEYVVEEYIKKLTNGRTV